MHGQQNIKITVCCCVCRKPQPILLSFDLRHFLKALTGCGVPWVPAVSSLGFRRPRPDFDHPLLSNAEVATMWN